MKQEQLIDLAKLIEACQKNDVETARVLLVKIIGYGFNPFERIETGNAKLPHIDLLASVIKFRNASVLKLMVEHAGDKIDFYRKLPGHTENLLQCVAAYDGGGDCYKILAECAENSGLNVETLINEPVNIQIEKDGKDIEVKCPFPHWLVLNFMTTHSILNNYLPPDGTFKENKKLVTSLEAWSKSEDFIFNKESEFNGNTVIFLPGPADTLDNLAGLKKYKLELSDTEKDFRGRTILDLAKAMQDFSKNIEDWKDFAKMEELYCPVQLHEDSYAFIDGHLSFVITVGNLRGTPKKPANPIELQVILYFEKLIETIEKHLANKKNTAGITFLSEKMKQHSNEFKLQGAKLEQHSDRLRAHSDELNVVPQAVMEKYKPANENQARIYNIVCKELYRKINAEDLKQSGVLEIKVTAKSAKDVALRSKLFQLLANFVPSAGAAAVISMALKETGEYKKEKIQAKHDQATADKIEMAIDSGMVHLIVDIANKIASEHALLTDGEAKSLAKNIVEQYNQIGDTFNGTTKEELLTFLCKPALTLKVVGDDDSPRGSDSSTSASSRTHGSHGSDSDGSKAAKPKKKGGGCVIS